MKAKITDENIREHFNDIEGVIEMLKITESLHNESIIRDQIRARIKELIACKREGGAWVDADDDASPTAWMTLGVYTEKAAREYVEEWTSVAANISKILG